MFNTLKIGDFHAYIVNNEKWYLVERSISSILIKILMNL